MLDRKIGAQLYTIREYGQTVEKLEEAFARISKIGYKTVQVSGIAVPAAEVKALCDKYNLEPIVTHRGYQEYTEKIDSVIEYHKTLGCNMCGLGCIHRDLATEEGISVFIETLKPAVEKLRKEGMDFLYHNHAVEFEKFGNTTIMERLINETDWDFIVDVYWLAYSGINPASFIKKLGKRAKYIHFKDLAIRNWNKHTIVEVMEGNLDFEEIVAACDEAGSVAAFVEQDTCDGDPLDSLEISYNNLKKLGFN